jgi:tRNA wybutosine-synthesizing protein 1
MTPTLDKCNLQCQFCWRHMSWQDSFGQAIDEPKEIVLGAIEGQKKLLSGYGGNPKADTRLYKEALRPNQTAISLTGEPTLYPYIGEMVKEYESRGIQTFLVTNGTLPEVIEKMERLPTQLYVTVAAPDEETYKRLCAPMGKRGWKDLVRTLEMIPSLSCRTVVRHTLVKGWNMHGVEEYARLDGLARPDFIEAKGYSFVGESRLRMTMENMPSHDEVGRFAGEIARRTGYEVAGQREDSRVFVLSEKPEKMRLPRRGD